MVSAVDSLDTDFRDEAVLAPKSTVAMINGAASGTEELLARARNIGAAARENRGAGMTALDGKVTDIRFSPSRRLLGLGPSVVD
jgi:citrate lyase beta subunit